jgi:hypothetical protein
LYSINTHDKSEDKKEEIIGSNMEEGMVNLKLNVIIAKNMVIMLGSVEAVLTMLKRKPIILKTRKQSPLCCHLIMEKKEALQDLRYLVDANTPDANSISIDFWTLIGWTLKVRL